MGVSFHHTERAPRTMYSERGSARLHFGKASIYAVPFACAGSIVSNVAFSELNVIDSEKICAPAAIKPIA